MALTDKGKLAWIRAVHSMIYIVMAAAVLFILYSGIVRYRGTPLVIALVLISLEGLVFFGNGAKCPFTSVAVKYGATKGYAFDTFLPEKFTRYTFWIFGALLVIGLGLLVFNR